jgi:hypothetical protein
VTGKLKSGNVKPLKKKDIPAAEPVGQKSKTGEREGEAEKKK